MVLKTHSGFSYLQSIYSSLVIWEDGFGSFCRLRWGDVAKLKRGFEDSIVVDFYLHRSPCLRELVSSTFWKIVS